VRPPAHTPRAEAVEARPWSGASGQPRPTVHVYPYGQRPGLWVYAAGAWRLGWVTARQGWADGTVVYQVEILLPSEGGPASFNREYRWPQEALRVAYPGRRPDTSGQ
jgi:hypothetical protein